MASLKNNDCDTSNDQQNQADGYNPAPLPAPAGI
jgi:hypothetical protein